MTLGLKFLKSWISHNPASIITPSIAPALQHCVGLVATSHGHWATAQFSEGVLSPQAAENYWQHRQECASTCSALLTTLHCHSFQGRTRTSWWDEWALLHVWAHIKVNVWNNLFCRTLVKLTGCRGFGMIAKLTCSAEGPGWSKDSIVIRTVLYHVFALKNQRLLNVPVPMVLDGIISKPCGLHSRTIPEAKNPWKNACNMHVTGVTADINSFKIYKLTNIIKYPRNKQPADLSHSAISSRGWHF